MIHHLSIPAHDPKKVAEVFAELFDGVCIQFPPNPGSYMAFARDNHGTAVEVYPADSVMKPNGQPGADFVRTGQATAFSPVHFALSVEHGLADIEALARREGWQCYVCDRGGHFNVVELWLENRFLVELLPPEFAARYVSFAAEITQADHPSILMRSHERPVFA
jgi:hypothetical protein